MFGREKDSGEGRRVISVSMNEEEYADYLRFKERASIGDKDLFSDSVAVKIAINIANQMLDKYTKK